MSFIVRKGVPGIPELWKRLLKGYRPGKLDAGDRELFRKQNDTPAAGRLFRVYGPGEGEITLIGLEPHPEDRKSKGYDRVMLSDLPPEAPSSAPGNPPGTREAKGSGRRRRK